MTYNSLRHSDVKCVGARVKVKNWRRRMGPLARENPSCLSLAHIIHTHTKKL